MKLILPFPPSVNNLFLNPRGSKSTGRIKTARYRDWIKRANDALWTQKLEFFTVPVEIKIIYEDAGKADLDNLNKATIDHLVRHQIIPNDDRKWVRKIETAWGPVKGAEIEITPCQ